MKKENKENKNNNNFNKEDSHILNMALVNSEGNNFNMVMGNLDIHSKAVYNMVSNMDMDMDMYNNTPHNNLVIINSHNNSHNNTHIHNNFLIINSHNNKYKHNHQ